MALTDKWHGLPKWAWAAGAGVLGVFAWRYYQSRKTANSSNSASTTSTAGLPPGYAAPLPGQGVLSPIVIQTPAPQGTPTTTNPGNPAPSALAPFAAPNPSAAISAFQQGEGINWLTPNGLVGTYPGANPPANALGGSNGNTPIYITPTPQPSASSQSWNLIANPSQAIQDYNAGQEIAWSTPQGFVATYPGGPKPANAIGQGLYTPA